MQQSVQCFDGAAVSFCVYSSRGLTAPVPHPSISSGVGIPDNDNARNQMSNRETRPATYACSNSAATLTSLLHVVSEWGLRMWMRMLVQRPALIALEFLYGLERDQMQGSAWVDLYVRYRGVSMEKACVAFCCTSVPLEGMFVTRRRSP